MNSDALQLLQAGGVLGLMSVILVTGARGLWIWARVRDDERALAAKFLDSMREDRNEWKSVAQTAATTASNLTGQVEKLTTIIETLTESVTPRRHPQ